MDIVTWKQHCEKLPKRLHGFFPPTAVPVVTGSAVPGGEIVFAWGRRTIRIYTEVLHEHAAAAASPPADGAEYLAPDITHVDDFLVVAAHDHATTLPPEKHARVRELADASVAWRDCGTFNRPVGEVNVMPVDGVWEDGPFACRVFRRAAKRLKLKTFRVRQAHDDETAFCIEHVDGAGPRILFKCGRQGARAMIVDPSTAAIVYVGPFL